MAVTNAQIITEYKITHDMDIDTPLFTFAAWKAQGRMVKKGEKSIHHVVLWKHTEGKKTKADGTEVKNPHCFAKTMYLFTIDQTEEIKGKA